MLFLFRDVPCELVDGRKAEEKETVAESDLKIESPLTGKEEKVEGKPPAKKEPVKRPIKRGLEAIWCKPKRRRMSVQKKRKLFSRHKAANAIVRKYKTSRQKNWISGSASSSSQVMGHSGKIVLGIVHNVTRF